MQKDRLAHSKNGIPYLKMIIRTEDAYKKGNTCEFTIMCFNRVAENCATYLNKGDNIIVEGGLSNQEQKNSSGNSIFKYVIIGTYIVFPNKNKSQRIYTNEQSKDPIMTPEEVAMYFGVANDQYAQPHGPNIKKNIEEDLEWEKKNFRRTRDDSVKTYELKDSRVNVDDYFNENTDMEDKSDKIENKDTEKENDDNQKSEFSKPSEDIDQPDPYKYLNQDNQYTFKDKDGTEYIEF